MIPRIELLAGLNGLEKCSGFLRKNNLKTHFSFQNASNLNGLGILNGICQLFSKVFHVFSSVFHLFCNKAMEEIKPTQARLNFQAKAARPCPWCEIPVVRDESIFGTFKVVRR